MCPISGSNWNNGTNAGAWALNLNNERSNSNNNVGGRSDLDSPLATRNGTVEQREIFSGDKPNLTAAPFLVAVISENQGAAL